MLAEDEFKLGSIKLLKLLKQTNPKILVFNGVQVYRMFLKHALNLPPKIVKDKIDYGRQPDYIKNLVLFAMPSSSPRAALFPAAYDKVPFYVGIKQISET